MGRLTHAMDTLTPTAAISINDLTVGYHGAPVIRNLSLDIAVGERVAILGPNGAGKSTLFRALTGLLQPHAGCVMLHGHPVRQTPAVERARLIAMVPQELDTSLPFTAGELVMMGRTATLGRWTPPSRTDHRLVAEAMELTGTRHLQTRSFREMSGGERQRVAIAMALAAQPQIILLDEPTSHLDMNHRLEILLLIERLNREQKMTILMIGHDLNLAAEYFPRLVLLQEGRLVADGSPEVVLTPVTLRTVYQCDVAIYRDPVTAVLRVFPQRP